VDNGRDRVAVSPHRAAAADKRAQAADRAPAVPNRLAGRVAAVFPLRHNTVPAGAVDKGSVIPAEAGIQCIY
jgi:hypothetical protein